MLTVDEIHKILGEPLSSESTRILILERLNSWSRIDITLEMFRAVYSMWNLIPNFLSIVLGLGRKLSSRDEDFMSCYSSVCHVERSEGSLGDTIDVDKTACGDAQFDLTYNIRHFELHGRELVDPWSCRQMAIYHKFDLKTRISNWILIQPPKKLEKDLKEAVIRVDDHPMSLHLRCLVVGAVNWRDYLNYLSNELKNIDDEVAIFKPFGDFGLNFSSKQQIHVLRRKLHHAQCILSNTSRTIAKIGAHEKAFAVRTRMTQSTHTSFQLALQNIRADIENYKQTVQKLLRVSKDIAALYDDILKLHGQELLHKNGLNLALIAQGDSHETRAMALLAEKTHDDSRIMRIATLVAMLYLPANLVVSFFSTEMVWYETAGAAGNSSDGSASLRVHREAWILVVATLFLTMGTFAASWWWERREKRCSRSHQRPHI
ncbi:hypothetical protein F4777DRAFT_142287 [Nemania sp. FL0916]|nr:hypothetical protein F4777DRAFT_142287 [Nemania sp. FL0916]